MLRRTLGFTRPLFSALLVLALLTSPNLTPATPVIGSPLDQAAGATLTILAPSV